MTREEKIKNRPPHNQRSRGLHPDDTKPHLGAISSVDLSNLYKFWNGQPKWTDYAPMCEMQRSTTDDWMDCTCEGKTNIIRIFDEINNPGSVKKSVRFLAKNSGVTRDGNRVENVDNSINSQGMVDKTLWPRDVSMDWNTYYSAIPASVKAFGKDWVLKNKLDCYVIGPNPDDMMNALQYGILNVTGYAWAKDSDGLYHDFGYTPNHDFIVVGHVKGVKWLVYDSYPDDMVQDDNENKQEFLKELAWDYQFGMIQLCVISPKITNQSNISLINKLKIMFTNLKAYMDAHGLHIFYIDNRGKQEILLTTIAEKALFMSYVKQSVIETVNSTNIQKMPDFKFF